MLSRAIDSYLSVTQPIDCPKIGLWHRVYARWRHCKILFWPTGWLRQHSGRSGRLLIRARLSRVFFKLAHDADSAAVRRVGHVCATILFTPRAHTVVVFSCGLSLLYCNTFMLGVFSSMSRKCFCHTIRRCGASIVKDMVSCNRKTLF